MAGYTGPLLAIAAIGALGAYTPSQNVQRNIYSSLDNCRRDNPQGGCALDAVRGVGPWHFASHAAASVLAIGVESQTRRGGFGGFACDGGEGGGGGG